MANQDKHDDRLDASRFDSLIRRSNNNLHYNYTEEYSKPLFEDFFDDEEDEWGW